MSGTPFILYIPEVALEKIFSFLSYDEIAKNRVVCHKFDEIGSNMLSRGFIQMEKRHAIIYKRVKSSLPRRESERRAHPLARHSDILQAVETRISMLNMTYMKYIEHNLLCFIPGKVLDEMNSVLCLLESNATPPRTHQLLQELRDLSSMAMEHFDEHILPRVKEEMDMRSALSYGSGASTSKAPVRMTYAQQVLITELHIMKKHSKKQRHHISYLSQNTLKFCQKLRKQNMRIKAQSLRIREQERQLQEQSTKIQEHETTLADIKKHIDEWDQKYADLTTELVRARDDILSKATTTTSSAPVVTSSIFYKSNIRPRVAHLLPKAYISLQMDQERKRKSNLLPEIPLKRNRGKEGGDIGSETPPDLLVLKNEINNEKSDSTITVFGKNDLSSIISSSIANLKNSLSAIKSRKRKMSEDIDLK